MSTTSSPLVKKIEKLVAQEAKADEKNLKHATKELQKAEKAYNKSVKVGLLHHHIHEVKKALLAHFSEQETQKAEKIVSKTAKEQVKTSKHVKKEESKFNNAVSKRQEAEKTLKVSTKHHRADFQLVLMPFRIRPRENRWKFKMYSKYIASCSKFIILTEITRWVCMKYASNITGYFGLLTHRWPGHSTAEHNK